MGKSLDFEPVEKGDIEFLDLRLPADTDDYEAIWEALEEYQAKCKALSTHQDEVSVHIKVDHPIILMFLSDLHIGAISGFYTEMRETVDVIAATDDCYVCSVGDTVDNYLPTWHPSGLFSVMCPPEIQKVLVEYLYNKMAGKLLALVQGCHDEASHFSDDFDWTKFLTAKFGCANLGFGGMLHLKVGETNYDVMMRHRYRYNSSFNYTHTVKRMFEMIGEFDIGVIAHNHKMAIEQTEKAGKPRVFVRPGSFKGADRYTRQLGFRSDSRCYMPCVVLFPFERKMMPFLHLRDAVSVLEGLRGG